MMHDRTFLARLCVDIDGVNMLVIFPRRRGCSESSCIRSSCANAVIMLLVMLVKFFWGGRCHGTFTFQKCQKMTMATFHRRRSLSSFHRRRSHLLKTGVFRKVMELKIQRKIPGWWQRSRQRRRTRRQ